MLKFAFITYGFVAALMAVWIAADRKSWLTRLHGAGMGADEFDFILAFLWGLAWPITLVIWLTKSERSSDEHDDHH